MLEEESTMNGLFVHFAMTLGAAAVLSSCAMGGDDGDSSDSAITGADDCQILVVKDQKFVDLKTFLADGERANDPVAQKVLTPLLQSGACTKNYTELQKLDTLQSCNLQTRIISERSMYLNAPDVGRALASRTCGGTDPTVLFLIDPIRANKDSIPPDVEMIGNNTRDGVFNYYAREPRGGPRDSFDPKDRPTEAQIWKFYGTSRDFVQNGYDCDVTKFHGACQSRFAQDNGVPGNSSGVRCASCHPGGGMVQKELHAPWTYWQTDPGTYTQKHKDVYGAFQPGVSFEPVTIAQNTRWAKTRVDTLAKKSVTELLRPAFCTMDINLQAGSGSIQSTFLTERRFGFANVPLDPTAYKNALTDIGQFVKTDPPFSSPKVDTPDTFLYPERGNLDELYLTALAASGKVSDDLITAILSVDFTRPIFSPIRCSLADALAGITDSTKAKDELHAKLLAKSNLSPAEGALKTALEATPQQIKQDTQAFINACTARGQSDKVGMANDAVKYAAHLRQVARLMKVKIKAEGDVDDPDNDGLGIIDFDETLPFTKADAAKAAAPVTEMHFDPKTCVLADDPK
jgi:hypothetical protein